VGERRSEELFATVATVGIDLSAGQAEVRLSGHPPPMVIQGVRVRTVEAEPAMMLGVLPGQIAAPALVPLPADGWAVLVYTDGLIEGRVGEDDRLGLDGLRALIEEHRRSGAPLAELPDWLVGQAELRNGGPLSDDVAMLLLSKERIG
jgi:serine phosphatase RsbU (regulator of sigma subunit)